MLAVVATILVTIFTVAAILVAAGPVMEELGSLVQSNDAVQEVGHDSIVPAIQQAVLEWVPILLVIGITIWGFAWIVRRTRFSQRGRI